MNIQSDCVISVQRSYSKICLKPWLQVFFKKWAIPGLFFIYFRLFNTVDNKQMLNKFLPMTGVEPRTSGIESHRSTN